MSSPDGSKSPRKRNYFAKGWSRSFQAIRQRKKLFLLLLIFQFVFLISLGTVAYIYQLRILENVQQIIVPLQAMPTDQASLEAGQVFGPEIIQVYQGYQALIRDITHFLLWMAGLFLVVNGAVWIMSHHLLGRLENWQERTKARLKFTLAALTIMGPLLAAGYWLVRAAAGWEMEMDAFTSAVKIAICFLLGGYYLLLVSFAFINQASWKQFVRKSFKAAVARSYLTLPVLALNLTLIAGNVYLIYYLLTYLQNFHLVVLSTILLVLVAALSKLFWISCLAEITE